MDSNIIFLDCTLRDGGYYNDWDYPPELVNDYLEAMNALKVDFVEIGFRSLINNGFKGAYAFSSDSFISSLDIPKGLVNKIGVMINGSEISDSALQIHNLEKLFSHKTQSPISLVRIACHVHEFKACLLAAKWLKEQGYLVGVNLMQVADRSFEELTELAREASQYPIDALYFADSMGSLNQNHVSEIILAFKKGWSGALGIHTHDNMGLAIANTQHAIDEGVTWIDSTVTGMGRGPGNAQTEYLSLALVDKREKTSNPTKLFDIIRKYFKPMQEHYGWGMNPFYYLTGKYGIHPSYIQSMLQDSRYNEEDILAVIDHLRIHGGKKFSHDTLENSRQFYSNQVMGNWSPSSVIKGREVLILGAGPSVGHYRDQIETYIEVHQPYVIALNTQADIRADLINVRAACHPVRLLAECNEYLKFEQPLITPASMLPEDVQIEFKDKELLDFGICIKKDVLKAYDTYCEVPNSLVISYTLAIASSACAKEVTLVGFDGFGADDPRRQEMDETFSIYQACDSAIPLVSLTPTQYQIPVQSIFGRIQ